jgi:hypothetical protein
MFAILSKLAKPTSGFVVKIPGISMPGFFSRRATVHGTGVLHGIAVVVVAVGVSKAVVWTYDTVTGLLIAPTDADPADVTPAPEPPKTKTKS